MVWSPDKWGPPFWKTIHITALYIDYLYLQKPHEALMRWKKFLDGITHALPCGQCEQHFLSFIQKNSPPTSSKGADDPAFLKWTIMAHNDVRRRNNKTTPSEEEVVNAYLGGQIYTTLPKHDVSLTKNTQFDSNVCDQVEKKLLGWQIGFGVVCFVMVVLLIIGLVAVSKANKYTPKTREK